MIADSQSGHLPPRTHRVIFLMEHQRGVPLDARAQFAGSQGLLALIKRNCTEKFPSAVLRLYSSIRKPGGFRSLPGVSFCSGRYFHKMLSLRMRA